MASLRKRKRSKRAYLVFGNQYSKKALNWMKRRKVKDDDDDDACDATIKTNMIDDLPENLLSMEVFSKLSNPRDVIVCKSVSKRWNSLISSSFRYKPSLALILNTHPPQCATNEISLESWKGFELRNYIDPKVKTPVCVLASHSDVLLCMKYASSRCKTQSPFYIVNPVTMRWTRVPDSKNAISSYPMGLSGNGSNGMYYVVILSPTIPYVLAIYLFDSVSCKWRYHRIEHPPWSQNGWCPTQRQALNLNGSLHWLAHDGPIVAYNPTKRHECIIIHRLQEMRHASYGDRAVVSETLTVSKGHVRIIQLVCYPLPGDHHHLRIWTLVDYRKSIWKQEHEPLYFNDMVSDLPWIQDYMGGYNQATTVQHSIFVNMRSFIRQNVSRSRIISPQPLHCHPNNPLFVYLYLSESIVSLDVITKKLNLVTRVSEKGQRSPSWNKFDKVTPMTLELNPSLIPDHERVLLPRP